MLHKSSSDAKKQITFLMFWNFGSYESEVASDAPKIVFPYSEVSASIGMKFTSI
jgi:hypothetical protein